MRRDQKLLLGAMGALIVAKLVEIAALVWIGVMT